MDYSALVDAIASRVSEKIAYCESTGRFNACSRPKLLILAQEHGDICHKLLESKRIGECYRTICALTEEYHVDAGDFEAAVLFNLTNDALARISGGICDTEYTALVMKLILLGKRIYVPRDQIELFKYEATTPAHYYAMLREKLTLLEHSGLVICCREELEGRILCDLENTSCKGTVQSDMESSGVSETCKEVRLEKKVINERDVKNVQINGAAVLHVGVRAIVTDLAKEYAHAKNIVIVRD